ncbi:MAG TPA: helix-turn-helix transcriptional regulator [Puia sp.]|nr:helix-turn-helix transcriptional regulator [Puia sp.]
MLQAGQNIRTIRELKNFTQDYVASKLRMSIPNYSNIENGKTDVTLTRLQQIAAVLQIDYRQILNLNPAQLLSQDSQPAEPASSQPAAETQHQLLQQLKIKDEQINRLLALLERGLHQAVCLWLFPVWKPVVEAVLP